MVHDHYFISSYFYPSDRFPSFNIQIYFFIISTIIIIMYYNEPNWAHITRNPLESREINRSCNDNTFTTSKRSSITYKPSAQSIKKRTISNRVNK